MKNLVIIFTSVLFFGCTQKSTNHDLIIANVSLIDGTGNTVQEGVTVSIDNGSIIAISDTLPQQVENVIDGTGKYLMPGFFDCHVHTGDYERDFPRFIHYGVTSVFITGGGTCTNEYYAAMRERGSQDTIPAPRVFLPASTFQWKAATPPKPMRAVTGVMEKQFFI